MADLISRQDAIDIATEDGAYGYISAEELEKIPSARPTGRWRRMPMACYGGGTITEYECSECEEHQLITSNYCPKCGAKMEVEHEID